MNKLYGKIALIIFVFMLGNISGFFLWHSPEDTRPVSDLVSNRDEPAKQQFEIAKESSVERFNTGSQSNKAKTSVKDKETGKKSTLSTEQQFLLDHPPPHITDQNFYLQNKNDPEIKKHREQAQQDYIQSLQMAGASNEDIQAALDEYDVISETDFGEQVHSNEPDSTTTEKAESLRNSLLEAGESEEVIAEQVENLNMPDDAQLTTSVDFDLETGLDHPVENEVGKE